MPYEPAPMIATSKWPASRTRCFIASSVSSHEPCGVRPKRATYIGTSLKVAVAGSTRASVKSALRRRSWHAMLALNGWTTATVLPARCCDHGSEWNHGPSMPFS